jgi:hypothetical protein
MQPDYLTKDVFEVWATNFDRRLGEALALRDRVEGLSEEVAVLADRSDRAEKSVRHNKGVSGVISAIVSGLVSGLINWSHR